MGLSGLKVSPFFLDGEVLYDVLSNYVVVHTILPERRKMQFEYREVVPFIHINLFVRKKLKCFYGYRDLRPEY